MERAEGTAGVGAPLYQVGFRLKAEPTLTPRDEVGMWLYWGWLGLYEMRKAGLLLGA